MYKEKKILAVIPARGGSKGIPRKNIVPINGKPLIQYSIDEARKSKYIDSLIVSTDDKEIAEISCQLGAEVPFLRPQNLAGDTAKTIDVLVDVVQKLKQQYDYLLLLQPTSPLRRTFHIDEAIQKIIDDGRPSLVSVCKVKEHPVLMRTITKNGQLKNLLDTNSTVRRQDFPEYYIVNGAIYINKLDDNFTNQTSLNDNILPYIMEQKYSLDIDEPQDLEKVKLFINEFEIQQ